MECTFLWFIENYSHCWHKSTEALDSPQFSVDESRDTWFVRLYPRGARVELEGNISLYLHRCEDDGWRVFKVKYELVLVAANGSTIGRIEPEHLFYQCDSHGYPHIAGTTYILLDRRGDYLPNDTLCVRCKVWSGEGNIPRAQQITARTRIEIEEAAFFHIIENFSKLQPNKIKTKAISSRSKKGLGFSSNLHYTDYTDLCCPGKIIIEIKPSNNHILSKYKVSLLDGSGNLIQCGEADSRLYKERKDIKKLALSLTRQTILYMKDTYLPNDQLSLLLECVFSAGVEHSTIEKTLHEMPSVAFKQINNSEDINKLSAYASTADDLKKNFNDQFLTDVEVKTETKSFSAHKIVLCARSRFLKSMVTSNMKEKYSGVIQIDDLEDDIVYRFLLFLYSDQLEKLDWESAIKLYYAADKYEVDKLKFLCSSFLVKNLRPSTASELLLLADTHSDSDLQRSVADFIFKHEEEVFRSNEWENLMKKNPSLVGKTMSLKYIKKL